MMEYLPRQMSGGGPKKKREEVEGGADYTVKA